jgi:hypothetical protein
MGGRSCLLLNVLCYGFWLDAAENCRSSWHLSVYILRARDIGFPSEAACGPRGYRAEFQLTYTVRTNGKG